MNTPILFTISLLLLVFWLQIGCKKQAVINPCVGKSQPSGRFMMQEMIGDTAFAADTVFRDNYVQFEATEKYESVLWKVGADPRNWTNPKFALSFVTEIGTLPITFTGKAKPATLCFPGDVGSYTSTQNLTIVEQVEKPNVTISPLVGRYRGAFIDSPSDIFTVRLDYFDSAKYNTGTTGSKNFYWLSNMPNGFTSTTNAAYAYPELKNGFSIEMGYKCFVFNYDSHRQGKAWLSHDTLYINSGDNLVGRRKFIGKRL